MNKGELIGKIAKDAKISKAQASNALNSAIKDVPAAYGPARLGVETRPCAPLSTRPTM